MAAPRVILDISASAFGVAVYRAHKRVASIRREFDRTAWPADWAATLSESRAQLTQAVGELQAGGLPTTVLYSTPGSIVAIGACPLGAGRAAALQAGALSLANVASFPVDGNPSDVRLLHEDAAGSNPAIAPRIHTIAAASPDAEVSLLTQWATQAGLNVDSTTPMEAALTCDSVRVAVAGEHPTAVLCVGEHVSVLAVGCAGRLELIRSIAAGTQTLVEALLRPIRPSGAQDAVHLNHSAARRLLAEIGIPEPDKPLPGLPGCTGASVLPLLQPVLQRFAIEIKQSLRFGVGESARAAVSLLLMGPGAAVPRLDAALARQASIALHPPIDHEPGQDPASIADAHLPDLPSLLAGSDNRRMTNRGLRRALLAGVAAAAALLTVDGVATRFSLKSEQKRLEAVRANSTGQEALSRQQEKALSARLAASALQRHITHTLGTTPDWGTALRVLADLVPPTVRVLEARLSNEGTPACNLNAYVRLDQTSDAAGEIRRFVDAVSHHPIVNSVRLGVTQRDDIRGVNVQTFELIVEFVPVESPFLGLDAPSTATANAAKDAAP